MSAWRLAGAAMMALSLAGCGGGQARLLFSADIPSNRAADGFMTRTGPAGSAPTVTLAIDNGAVQAGIDPATSSDSRAFLDFPLDGPGGVPPGANIVSAFLHVFVSRIDVATDARFPLVLEIVAPFAPLDASDFDASAASTLSVTHGISPTRDNGNFVNIDVAPLLEEAIADGLRGLALRVRPGVSSTGLGLAVIEDNAIFDTAPRLQVEYFRN